MAATTGRRGDAPRGQGRPTGNAVAVVHPEVAKQGGIAPFIATYERSLARVVPTHVSPEAFIALAVAYVNRDSKLKEAATANPAALVLALRECAVLGHMPVPKTFALLPFRDNSRDSVNGWAISGVETYHGVIERMYRSGAVQSVRCNLVRANDDFDYDDLTQTVLRHKVPRGASEASRGDREGVYAYAVMLHGGLSRAVWLTAEEVAKHKAMAKTDKFWEGTWQDAMWLKTACHALETWVPTSAEYRAAMAQSEAAATRYLDVPAAAAPPAPPAGRGDYVDADVVSEPPTAPYGPSVDGPDPSEDDTDSGADQAPDPGDDDPTGGADPDNDPPAPSQAGWPATASPGSGAIPQEGTK